MPQKMNKPETVAIIGLGLLGASLGMALRDKGLKRLGWTRRPEVREWAVKENVVDSTAEDICEVLSQADITVFCLPIPEIISYIERYAASWKPGAIVTDIGSVKEVIVNCGEKNLLPRGVRFVGSHPMAGTEKSGPFAAFPELYNKAEVFVTNTPDTCPEAIERIIRFWESINTKTVRIGVREHDILVAHTSHISHVLALALTQAVLDCPEKEQQLRYSGCATGFRDTSRITSSSPVMWREIIENNQPAVLESVREVEKRWQHIRQIIENKQYEQLQEEFAKGKKLRDDWIKYKNSTQNCNW
jgi:prephenate dehydrogenase